MSAVQDFPVRIGPATYTFRYSWLAFATLTDSLGATFATVVEAMQQASAMDTEVVVWAGLRTHHPYLTRDDVRVMMDDSGVIESMKLVNTASAAFAASLEPEGGSAAARPLLAAIRRLLEKIGRLILFWRKRSR